MDRSVAVSADRSYRGAAIGAVDLELERARRRPHQRAHAAVADGMAFDWTRRWTVRDQIVPQIEQDRQHLLKGSLSLFSTSPDRPLPIRSTFLCLLPAFYQRGLHSREKFAQGAREQPEAGLNPICDTKYALNIYPQEWPVKTNIKNNFI